MVNERASQPANEKPAQPKPERAGRSGEGAGSVIPYLKADQRARAAAKIAKRREREF